MSINLRYLETNFNKLDFFTVYSLRSDLAQICLYVTALMKYLPGFIAKPLQLGAILNFFAFVAFSLAIDLVVND